MKRTLDKLLRHPPARFVADVLNVYFSKRVGRAAAELAYFLILTFFPIIICISAFVDMLHLDMASLLDQAANFLPGGVVVIFREYLNYIHTNQSTAMLLSGAFLAVLFASAAVRGLMNIMHEIYGRATFRGLWQLVASVLFSILLVATIYLSMAVVVTGNWFFHSLGQLLKLDDLVERFGTWQWVKYLLLLGMVFLFILLLYRFAAPLDRPRPPVVPGAMAAAVALAIASMIFSALMSGSTQYSLIYGSLASVVNYVIYKHRKEARR